MVEVGAFRRCIAKTAIDFCLKCIEIPFAHKQVCRRELSTVHHDISLSNPVHISVSSRWLRGISGRAKRFNCPQGWNLRCGTSALTVSTNQVQTSLCSLSRPFNVHTPTLATLSNMAHAHLSAAPMDPYQWRESVLSTRSLSYLSTYDALGSPALSHTSRNPSLSYFQTRPRRNTAGSESQYSEDLEMADAGTRAEVGRQTLEEIPELPESVAGSLLFTLPREIRDRIYAFALTAKEGLPVEWPPLPSAHRVPYGLSPALLRTCRIISSEAGPVLYTANALTFHHPSDANIFARSFANPALARRHVQNLSLHIKHSDTRLWMSYLNSNDDYRSLKNDFLGLRELNIRYRSNKWSHSVSPEQNLKNWCDDARLDEIIDGLRQLYYPPPLSRGDGESGVKPLNQMTGDEFMEFINARKPGEDMDFKYQLLDLHRAHVPPETYERSDPPLVKVVCACRVHSAHFNFLATPHDPYARNARSSNALGLLGQAALPNLAAAVLPTAMAPGPPAPTEAIRPPEPVREGDRFRNFTAIDFWSSPIKRLHDPDLGSAKVARTPFSDKNNILIALEIHCLDPKRDAGGSHSTSGFAAGGT
jgi:hypothetical protein